MATSWTPAYDQDDPSKTSRVVSAQTNDSSLDDWFHQQHVFVAETPLSVWLLSERGYEKPPRPYTVWPPTNGRGWTNRIR